MFNVISLALQTHIQKVLTEYLKVYFTYISDYRYDPDFSKSSIFIYSEFPKVTLKYPSIVLGTISGDGLLRTIGNRNFSQFYGDRIVGSNSYSNVLCGIVRGGGNNLNIDIHIITNTGSEARLLKDYVEGFFSISGIEALQSENIAIKNIRLLNGSTTIIGNEIIRVETLQLSVYTEWRETIWDIPLISGISSIGISSSIY